MKSINHNSKTYVPPLHIHNKIILYTFGVNCSNTSINNKLQSYVLHLLLYKLPFYLQFNDNKTHLCKRFL